MTEKKPDHYITKKVEKNPTEDYAEPVIIKEAPESKDQINETPYSKNQISKIQSTYRQLRDQLRYEALMSVWDNTGIEPEPSIFGEVFEKCETIDDLLMQVRIISRFTRGKVGIPQNTIYKFAKQCLDNFNVDAFRIVIEKLQLGADKDQTYDLVQEAYKYFLDNYKLAKFKALIQFTRIAPEKEIVKTAHNTYWKDGRLDKVESLEIILSRNVKNQEYNLQKRIDTSDLDSILSKI